MATETQRTSQEDLWAGEFGEAYIDRNRGVDLVGSNTELFRKVLAHTDGVGSVLELGCNIGNNLRALRDLLPEAQLHAVEINAQAAAEVEAWGGATVEVGSILDFEPAQTWDLTFTKGVLIHINPDRVADVYAALVRSSNRYVMVCEYFNPVPVEVSYRGHEGALFKRDFAGEMLDAFPELRLVDYGFTYHRDPQFPLDDSTWFLMEKQG
ncbi:pseudaminic acid biosynthesis-associated methylase [Pedococcus dokdonensis]|uniref:Pseudaminic acid biosynthesis-associated methylase n=1 Tax=Pedococcus dokdonensis TaxID=443156 RepID=A0A1H0LB40_9MICO|nr:pseudaminic acid biosynthesis-associated methylase [Pedococcus dokdonensis]SDO65170.1 pseudaminic acid biosynthesis-associated methylase [Pedococcus dokdonensis]